MSATAAKNFRREAADCFGSQSGFADQSGSRHVTVAFVDGELWQVAAALGPPSVSDGPREWAGPLERVDAYRWDWFATLTPR